MTNIPARTSDTHPLRIDVVQASEAWGAIGMAFCPGKLQSNARTGAWNRELLKDLTRIRAWGAQVVVSLIEEHEFAELDVAALPEEVERLGMVWRHLPIRDMYPPGERFRDLWPAIGAELLATLAAGQRVFIHCKGGLGRTGVVAACLLREMGVEGDEAVLRVRAARRMTIETSLQEWFVMCYEPIFGRVPAGGRVLLGAAATAGDSGS